MPSSEDELTSELPAVGRRARVVRAVRSIAVAAGRHRLRTLLILAAGAFMYSQCLRPPPWASPEPLLLPSSTARSVLVGPHAWAAPGGDAGATRTTAASPPIEGEIAWRRQLDAPVTTPLITDGKAIYVALKEARRIVALASDDGHELWSTAFPGFLDHAPTVAGDTLYVQVRGAGMVALSAETGAAIWIDESSRPLTATPTVLDGVLWAGMRGRLVAMDVETAQSLGELDIGSRFVRLQPVVGGDRVVVAKTDMLLFFDRRTGARTFQVRLRVEHVAIAHGTVIGVSPRQLVAFDADASAPWWDGVRDWWFRLHIYAGLPPVPASPHRWVQRTSCEPRAPVLQPAQVVLACAEGAVRAYDLSTGELRWERKGAPIVTSPVLTARGLLIVERRALVLLDPDSGEELSRRTFEGIDLRDVAVTNDAVYLLTLSDELIALR